MFNIFELQNDDSSNSVKEKNNSMADKKSFGYITKFICIALTVVLFITLFVLALSYDKIEFKKMNDKQNSSTVLQTVSAIRMEVSLYTEDVPIVGASVIEYMNGDVASPASEVYKAYKKSGERLDIGLPVKLHYDVFGLPEDIQVKSASVYISEDEKFSEYSEYIFEENSKDIEISFLKTGVKYYYRININMSNDLQTSTIGSFNTLATPRFLNVEGIYNVRDIGGWKTIDGKTVKQGILYRGTELDASVNPEFCATEKGLSQLIDILGVRNDIDLRGDIGKEIYSDRINRKFYSVNASYSEFFEADKAKYIRNLFSALSETNTYPAYMHCTYGVDRTGTVCYLLGAILGVSEEDLMRDYQLSALYCSDVDNDAIKSFIEELKKYPGDNIQENAESFLLSVGVKSTEIQNIRNIFLED